MRLQEYREAKAKIEQAKSELKAIVTPICYDVKRIQEYHSATLTYYGVDALDGVEKERFITAVMLLYSPLSIYDNKHSPRYLNSAISRVLGISNSAVSQILSRVRFYYQRQEGERRSVDNLVDYLTT